jgi:transcriptional regulator with XRE-family HTH domain
MDEPKPMRELTRIREERGLSQQGLADASGVNKATINQIERGRRSPNLETLEKLTGALAVEMADFFPKAQASLPDFEEAEQRRTDAYELARGAARRQAVQNKQAANRAFESGRPQTYFMHHENETVMKLSKYPADELAGALVEATAALEDERHDSIVSKAIAVAAERWAGITSDYSSDRGSVSGIYLVAADLENLLSVVMGDTEGWEKLSRLERSEIATVMAALGRVTEGYHTRADEEHATEQRRAMMRQWTRELEKSA